MSVSWGEYPVMWLRRKNAGTGRHRNMRNSIQHKTNVSREKLAVLEELLSTKQKEYEATMQEYNKQSKDREIDILWQELKSQKGEQERSPGVYLSIGFVAGALAMFLMTSIINFGVQSENTADLNLWKKSSISTKQAAVNVAPAGTESVLNNMSYTVKNGDTLETIAVKYYGVASQANIQKLQKANNIKNPHSIKLGQKLTIPVSD